MTSQTLRRTPSLPLALAILLGLAGCVSVPAVSDVSVVVPQPATKAEAARARAVQDMRLEAVAAETKPYPDVFAVAATDIANPPPMSEVAATEEHLTRLGRRSRAASPGSIAAGQARAQQLRRLGKLRVQEAEQAIRNASKKQ